MGRRGLLLVIVCGLGACTARSETITITNSGAPPVPAVTTVHLTGTHWSGDWDFVHRWGTFHDDQGALATTTVVRDGVSYRSLPPFPAVAPAGIRYVSSALPTTEAKGIVAAVPIQGGPPPDPTRVRALLLAAGTRLSDDGTATVERTPVTLEAVDADCRVFTHLTIGVDARGTVRRTTWQSPTIPGSPIPPITETVDETFGGPVPEPVVPPAAEVETEDAYRAQVLHGTSGNASTFSLVPAQGGGPGC